MIENRKDIIQKEIRRRAFLRSDALLLKNEYFKATHNTLDALEDVTGLPRTELESIANEVRYAFKPYDTDFFSIKNQLVTVLGSFAILIVLFWLLIVWII
jgi:hypothetical protein